MLYTTQCYNHDLIVVGAFFVECLDTLFGVDCNGVIIDMCVDISVDGDNCPATQLIRMNGGYGYAGHIVDTVPPTKWSGFTECMSSVVEYSVDRAAGIIPIPEQYAEAIALYALENL